MNSKAFLTVLLVQIYYMQTLQHSKASKVDSNSSQNTTELAKDIGKLENEFTSTYKTYKKLHAKIVHNITNQELIRDLEAFGKRSLNAETRFRRSGACAKICIHRCLESCNLACCIERPKGINRHAINKMEVEAAKKMVTGSKKSILVSKKDRYLSKEELEKGTSCDPKCRVHCDPSCKFRCCIRVPRD